VITRLKLLMCCECDAVLPQAHGMAILDWTRKAIGDDTPADPGSWSVRPMQPDDEKTDVAGRLRLRDGREYSVDVAALEPRAASALAEADLPPHLEIEGASFAVRVTARECVDPLAWYEASLGDNGVRRAFVRWRTPTAFSVDGRVAPLPHPAMLFEHWARAWDARGMPVSFGDDGLALLASTVRVRPVFLHGSAWLDSRGVIPAFIGAAILTVPVRESRLVGVALATLARYAEFSGTGIRTHHGMGATDVRFG
jgi:hypothetical protein